MQRVTALLTAAAVITIGATFGTDAQTRRDRFRMRGETDTEQTPSSMPAAAAPAPRVTEAPTGFDNQTNGFRPAGPGVRDDRRGQRRAAALVQRQPLHLRGGRDRRRRPRPDLQRAELPRVPPERRRPAAPARSPSIARVGSWATNSSSRSAARSCIRARPIPTSSSSSSFEDDIQTFRISTNTLGAGFVEAIANTTLLRDSRAVSPRRCAGSRRARARCSRPTAGPDWPVRLEEPAREPRVVRRRRLSQRDGHHEPALPDGEHLERPRRQRFRSGARSRGRRRRRRGVRELHARDESAVARPDRRRRCSQASNCSARHRLRDVPRRRRS